MYAAQSLTLHPTLLATFMFKKPPKKSEPEQTELLLSRYTRRMPPQSRHVALTARLERIKHLADDLARAHGAETAVSRALADRMKQEADAVRRALQRLKS